MKNKNQHLHSYCAKELICCNDELIEKGIMPEPMDDFDEKVAYLSSMYSLGVIDKAIEVFDVQIPNKHAARQAAFRMLMGYLPTLCLCLMLSDENLDVVKEMDAVLSNDIDDTIAISSIVPFLATPVFETEASKMAAMMTLFVLDVWSPVMDSKHTMYKEELSEGALVRISARPVNCIVEETALLNSYRAKLSEYQSDEMNLNEDYEGGRCRNYTFEDTDTFAFPLLSPMARRNKRKAA